MFIFKLGVYTVSGLYKVKGAQTSVPLAKLWANISLFNVSTLYSLSLDNNPPRSVVSS